MSHPSAAESRKTGVLFISSADYPGADTFVHMLIMRSLDRARFDVHVAGPKSTGSAGYQMLAGLDGIRLVGADFGPSLTGHHGLARLRELSRVPGMALGFLGLAWYIRTHRIRVLHSTDRPRDAVACAVLGRITGAKSVIHAHVKCAPWMSRPLLWAMRQADALVAISAFVARSLVDMGYSPERTHAILNGINLPAWDWRLDGSATREALGIPAGAPVVACAARLFRAKGQAEAVRAVAAVRSHCPAIRLLIIGSDDRQVMRESFTEELKGLVASLGLQDHVLFTGQRSDMPALMAASDVFMLPSDEEPFGLVFAEAMAMKRPVLAIANGGTPEVVEHGKSGFLCAPNDVDSLAEHLRRLLEDPDLRARMGEYGRMQVEARFTSRRLAGEVARLYDSLIAGSPVAAVARPGC
jgi:glycosyltransferase involved in cell wall biosynthesis